MVTYQNNLNAISEDMLQGFFEGWGNHPDREIHYKILKNSSHIVLALEENRVIGFINAVSDKVLSAYIPLLEVLSEYRGRGIGKKLVDMMLVELKDYYMVDLCCDDNLAKFYEKYNMFKICGMVKRNYSMRKGKIK